MKFSIVIPTLNEEGVVGELLGDLASQRHLPHEVLVIDGRSEDKTCEEVINSGIARLVVAERGVARQRNRGAREATGEVVVFLDADTRIDQGFLHNLKTKFALSPHVGLVGFKYKSLSNKKRIKIIYEVFNWLFGISVKVFPAGAGMAVAVRKEVLDKYGFFDEQLAAYEDMEFIGRIAKKTAYHIWPIPVQVSARRFEKYGYLNTVWLYVKLSVYFLRGRLRYAEKEVSYEFGKFSRKKKD